MNLDKVLYFMNQFIEGELNGFDEEQYELEQKYVAMFGHGVPREMFPPCISEADIMKAVKQSKRRIDENIRCRRVNELLV